MSIAMVFSILWALVIYEESRSKEPIRRLCLKTPLCGGDIYGFLHDDLLSAYRLLASGRVEGDGCSWAFIESPLYTEAESPSAARKKFESDMDYVVYPDKLTLILNTHWIGLFSILRLSYSCETRKMSDGKYRCALTGLAVEKWRSPYGYICPRDEAIECYRKCSQRINMVAKMVIAARRPNGEPLTKKEKLKYVHDWLINSASYDYKGLRARKKKPMSYTMTHLEYLFNEYGAIVDGKTICEGYSVAFKAIVDELIRRKALKGVKCDIAVNNSHAWNRVQLGGRWYNIDVTWDDSGVQDLFRKVSTDNFLVSDRKHRIKKYGTYEYSNEPATDRRYEKMKWPRFKM